MPLDAIGVDSFIALPVDSGCRYILADGLGVCARVLRPGSSYCQHHHTLCHLSTNSASEAAALRDFDILANKTSSDR